MPPLHCIRGASRSNVPEHLPLQSPYDPPAGTLDALFGFQKDDAVNQLRTEHGADLVQLAGFFSDYCGVG